MVVRREKARVEGEVRGEGEMEVAGMAASMARDSARSFILREREREREREIEITRSFLLRLRFYVFPTNNST